MSFLGVSCFPISFLMTFNILHDFISVCLKQFFSMFFFLPKFPSRLDALRSCAICPWYNVKPSSPPPWAENPGWW